MTITSFRSRRQISCDVFISEARELLLFDASHPHQIKFDAISWNLKGHVTMSGSPKSLAISFKTPESPRGNAAKALPGRFGEVVRAIVARKIWETRSSKLGRAPFQFIADAGKKLHTIMLEDGIEGDPTQLTRDHLDRCVSRAGMSRRHVAQPLADIARILAHAEIAPDLEGWKDARKSTHSHSSRLNPQRKRESLTDAEVGAIADAFHHAKEPVDQVVTSILALLCCAPSRIGEIFSLPADAEIADRPGDDFCDEDTPFEADIRFHYGLRWWPEKGGAPMVKFVAAEMVPVAREALRRLRHHTEAARNLSVWMIQNSNIMPLPDHLSHVRQSRRITTQELASLYDYNPDAIASKSGYSGWIRVETGVYCFDSIEEYWRKQMPKYWPSLTDTNAITYDRALMVSLGHQFSDTYFTDETRVSPIGEWILSDALSSTRGKPSIFERLNIALPDGSFPKITTHRIRHYLNTIAQRANVPQAHIAHWSGRKRVMQNADYDHTDIDAIVDEILRGKPIDIGASVPAIVDDTDDETKAAMIRQNVTSTPIGFCLGDLRFEPCDKAGACIDCTRLVCIAGDQLKIENLEQDVERRRVAVENFEQASAAGRRANPRAMQAAEAALSHGQNLLAALADPENKGSLILNSDAANLPGFRQAERILQSRASQIDKDEK